MSASKKRKASDEPERRSFEAAIPQGLSAGSTFVTTVKIGETVKKVRLTVPEGGGEVLRFALQVNETDVADVANDPETATR